MSDIISPVLCLAISASVDLPPYSLCYSLASVILSSWKALPQISMWLRSSHLSSLLFNWYLSNESSPITLLTTWNPHSRVSMYFWPPLLIHFPKAFLSFPHTSYYLLYIACLLPLQCMFHEVSLFHWCILSGKLPGTEQPFRTLGLLVCFYLAMPGLSCSTWDLCFSMHALSCDMQDLVP